MLRMCVCMYSRFVKNHPIQILEDELLIFDVVLSQGRCEQYMLVSHHRLAIMFIMKTTKNDSWNSKKN
jgi:hypothetical protein